MMLLKTSEKMHTGQIRRQHNNGVMRTIQSTDTFIHLVSQESRESISSQSHCTALVFKTVNTESL